MTFPENPFRNGAVTLPKVQKSRKLSPHADHIDAMAIGAVYQADEYPACQCAYSIAKRYGKRFTSKKNKAGYLITRIG